MECCEPTSPTVLKRAQAIHCQSLNATTDLWKKLLICFVVTALDQIIAKPINTKQLHNKLNHQNKSVADDCNYNISSRKFQTIRRLFTIRLNSAAMQNTNSFLLVSRLERLRATFENTSLNVTFVRNVNFFPFKSLKV